MREHGFYESDDKQPGQSKPGVKFSKVNRVQSEDGVEEDDDSCIDSEVSSDSSMMSVDRPPMSIVWKDRPKYRKVSKIRTVSTIHRTTRLEPPTEDTTSNTAPQANDGDTAVAVEKQAQPEPMIQDQAAQPPVPARRRSRRTWPYGSGMPGFGAYHGTSWHDSDSEENEEWDKHDDPPRLAPTPNAQENPAPIARTSKRCRETEARSSNEPPELIKDDESSDDDNEHRATGKMSSDPKSSESTWHFDMCLDLSSSDSNPADNEPITNDRNEGYPKNFVDEFENLGDFMITYVRYRIAGGRMKFKESDYHAQLPGLELEDIGDWYKDYNNMPPCEWTMSNPEYAEWYLSTHPKPVDIREATRYWLNRQD